MTQHIGVINPKDLEVPEFIDSVRKVIPDIPYKNEILGGLERDIVQMSLPVDEIYQRQAAIKYFFENKEARELVLGLSELPPASQIPTEVPYEITKESYETLKEQLQQGFSRIQIYRENAEIIGNIHNEDNPVLVRDITAVAETESKSLFLEEILQTQTDPIEAWAETEVSMKRSRVGYYIAGGVATIPWLVTIPWGGLDFVMGTLGTFLGGAGALVKSEDDGNIPASFEEASQFILYFKNKRTGKDTALPMTTTESQRDEFFTKIQRKDDASYNPGDGKIFPHGRFNWRFTYDQKKDRVNVQRENKKGGFVPTFNIPLHWPNTAQQGVYRENDYLVRDTGLLYARELGTIDTYGEDLELLLNLTHPFEERMKEIISYAAVAEWASNVQQQKRPIHFPSFIDGPIKLEGMLHPILASKNQWIMPNNFDESEGRLRGYTGPLGNGKSVHILGVGLNAAMAQAGLPTTAKFAQYRYLDGVLVQTSRTGNIEEELSRMMNDAKEMRKMAELVGPNAMIVLDDTYIGAPHQDSTSGLIEAVRALDSTDSTIMVATHLHDVARWIEANGGVNYHVKAEEDGERLFAIRPGMSTKSHMDRVLREQGSDYQGFSNLFKRRIAEGTLSMTPKMTAYLGNEAERTA